ncbi:MAG TPA: TlpA disulfide reductase family protein [Methylococcaceae bacterium]|nr:TlpA disulfide reductase family protein [Methylococcaceae bacterium]
MTMRKTATAVCAALALAFHSSVQGIETGRSVPNCRLAPLGAEQEQELHQYLGKVLYVDFWASWCGPCAQSFPFMNDLAGDLQSGGLQILAVNLDENREDAQAFLAQRPANFTILADAGGKCAQDFGVQAMPSSYLVDRQGVVRHVHMGFRSGEAQEFRALVEELLATPSASP